MKKLLILLLLSLGYISSANAAIPEWTGQNTIVDICRKIDCHDEIKKFYKQYYFTQTFHKALVISYYKSGNRYINDYFGYSYKEQNSAEAKNKAMRMCQKHGKKCELLLLNNQIYNKQLYGLLTSSSSYSSNSSNKIPANAYKVGNSWNCKSGYTKTSSGKSCIKNTISAGDYMNESCKSGYYTTGSGCIKLPANAYASNKDSKGWKCKSGYYQLGSKNCYILPSNAVAGTYGYGFQCNSGYEKSGSYCISGGYVTQIPANAHASGNGWTCNTDYYKSGSLCHKVPANAYSPYTNNDFFCNSGYIKSGNSCIKKINIPANAHLSGNSWICNTDYYRNTSLTGCLRVPANASSSYNSNYWKCKSGYKRVGNGCEKELSEIYIDGNKYVGELRNGKPHGKGTMTYTDDGDKYVGEWKNGKRHGQGTLSSTNGDKFVSQWRNDKPYGQFTLTFTDGTIYSGDAKDELKFATITYPNGDKYTGELNDNNGDRHGQGKMTYANGTTKEGIWKDDEFQYAKNESTPKNNYSNDEELIPAASGSGFAVTSDGYVVTNNHVVQDCNNVEIYHKGRAIPAIVVNVDPIIDLAIIKGNFRPEKFYYLSTKRPRLRLSVDVIGYGFGKKISSNVKITRGIISSLVGIENDSSRFQIDAAVQPGNSGGPIIDSDEKSPTYGNVIGVAVEKVNVDWAKENLSRVPENIAFGIKSGAVINFLDGNNIEYSTNNKLSDDEIDALIHGGTYYLSCLMTMSQYEKVKKTRVLFSDLE